MTVISFVLWRRFGEGLNSVIDSPPQGVDTTTLEEQGVITSMFYVEYKTRIGTIDVFIDQCLMRSFVPKALETS